MRPTDGEPTPLFTASPGLFASARIRRILSLAGYRLTFGLPRPGDTVAVWGAGRAARRGAALARASGAQLLRLEDAFLRSLRPGRSGEPPVGLLLDRSGLHHDAARQSDLETMLATHPLSDPALLARAASARAAMARAHLSKYAATLPDAPLPRPGYVVVIDQVRGDAATLGQAPAFASMLARARAEHPGAQILLKTHPETRAGYRPGFYGRRDIDGRTTLLDAPVSPVTLFGGARGVYTYSSTLGLEAIWAGRKPVVFGSPIYAGWGLSRDIGSALPRRTRALTADQLFAATMILAPLWYDPYRDRLCELEEVILGLAARARAWREDRTGWTAAGMSFWKRRHLRAMFGQMHGIRFTATPAPPRRHMVWARSAGSGGVRVEDGFLRSRGLGAALTPPLSLVLDDLGIHYDPSLECRLERLIASSPELPLAEIERTRSLIGRITGLGLSKYNIGAGSLPELPPGRRVLVVGQVEDDASVVLGAGRIAGNAQLLAAARAANPGSPLLYKPHPDVEAGLRRGAVEAPPGVHVIAGADPAALLGAVSEVWTMTSLLGFEALLRGLSVTVTGAPFYAGWGLTRDLGAPPARRIARPTLEGLAHAALIGYPRYHDPVTGLACPPEVAVDRLAGAIAKPGFPGLAAVLGLRSSLPGYREGEPGIARAGGRVPS